MGGSSPHPEVQEPTKLVGGGCELWSSKALNLVWLPRCDNRHNPSLLSATLPEAVSVENPPTAESDGQRVSASGPAIVPPIWFWRVEPTFGAWVCRAIQRADSSKASLDAILREMSEFVRFYLEREFPGCWPGVEKEARAGPVVLPGSEIVAQVVGFARYDPALRWAGWEKLAEKFDADWKAEHEAGIADRRLAVADVPPVRAAGRSAIRPRGRPPAEPTELGLFR